MASTANGFGICGHKNHYSSGVRVGNWVEDVIGQDLVGGARRAPEGQVQSETRANIIRPDKMEDRSSRNSHGWELPDETLAIRESRVGLPYMVMFAHASEEEVEQMKAERFTTTNQLFNNKDRLRTDQVLVNSKSNRRYLETVDLQLKNNANRERAKRLAREQREIKNRPTTKTTDSVRVRR